MIASNDQGMRTRREVLGDDHVNRTIENLTDFTEPWMRRGISSSWA
jgi:hypothetical protein